MTRLDTYDLGGPLDPDTQPPRLRMMMPPTRHSSTSVDEDDCAVITAADGSCWVFTTDFLNASPICLELGIGEAFDLGWVLVGANVADLCGTGANPIGILTAVTMPRDARQDDFDQIMAGVVAAASDLDIDVLGGDTKLGPARSLCATAIGSASTRDRLFLRSGAGPGQDVWVSGEVGSVSAAVLALTGGPVTADVDRAARLAITRPRPPMAQSRAASTTRRVSGGTDLSDGLGADLTSLARSSGVGIEIEAERIPIAGWARTVAQLHDLPPWAFAFGLGGDFQFVCTVERSVRDVLEAAGLTRVGRTTEDQGLWLVAADGDRRPMPRHGHSDSTRTTFEQENRHMLGMA